MVGATDPSSTVRRLLLWVLTFGLLMTFVDLVLLEHYEDSWMLVPLFLIALTVVATLGHLITGSAASIRLLQGVFVLLMTAGALGVVLHFRGNLEFQVEIDPTLSRWELFKKVMHAKAPPALAPGSMVQFGLLGLVYCFRHPALRRDRHSPATTTGVTS
jgi:hypothetical protein